MLTHIERSVHRPSRMHFPAGTTRKTTARTSTAAPRTGFGPALLPAVCRHSCDADVRGPVALTIAIALRGLVATAGAIAIVAYLLLTHSHI